MKKIELTEKITNFLIVNKRLTIRKGRYDTDCETVSYKNGKFFFDFHQNSGGWHNNADIIMSKSDLIDWIWENRKRIRESSKIANYNYENTEYQKEYERNYDYNLSNLLN